MRWGAMLWTCLTMSAGLAVAEDASPTFGSEGVSPFQVVVNPATGLPLVVPVPAPAPAQAAK